MNKFVKLPLFLGVTCLAAAGLLSGVVAITDPIIEEARLAKLAKVYENMYQGETVSVLATQDTTDEQKNAGLQDVAKVQHGDKVSVVYQLKSKSKYETLVFYAGISTATNAVDSYYCFETSTSSLGYGQFKNDENITSKYDGYTGGGVVVAGVTYTSKAVSGVIDAALKDYSTRTW